MTRVALILSILCAMVNPPYAQTIDPYRRVTDPRAIYQLDCDDCEPLRFSSLFGLPQAVDERGAHIFAQDTGAGIITHIWMTTGEIDSLTELRLYVDGQLIVSSTLFKFFSQRRGVLRGPLDSVQAGGAVCDVQIPYRKSFRITFKAPGWNVYHAIAWRPIKDPARIAPFVLQPTVAQEAPQRAAEARLRTNGSPWTTIPSQQTLSADTFVAPRDALKLVSIKGSGLVQTLKFRFPEYEARKHDSLWLKVYYDGSPFPSINAPVFDFFLSGTRFRPANSLPIKASVDSGLICYLPMPFGRSIRVELTNSGADTERLSYELTLSSEPIDRASSGYLHATFSESPITRIGIPHPVLHIRGKGKFVGLYHGIPRNRFMVAMEGDPMITVDSNPRHYMRYTGGEDYYNAGWWFSGTLFSLPFAGHHDWSEGFYRFHYMDAVDFKESLDFDFQHGVNNDIHENYRTVAYYYKQWTSFWTYRDTIKGGEDWRIDGAGYQPGEEIHIRLAGFPITLMTASDSGTFSAKLKIPDYWNPGKYLLDVNGHQKPEFVYVIQQPEVRLIADHLPPTLTPDDTLIVTGTGFLPGERVKIFFDSIPITHDKVIITDYDYRFTTSFTIPYLPDHTYNVVARGDYAGDVVASDPVNISRTLNYEFEQLLPAVEKTSETLRREDVSYFYHWVWSEQSLAYFEAAGKDSFVTFGFDVPRSDTFDVNLFATIGFKFGDYQYALDGVIRGEFKGFKRFDWGDPRRSDTIRVATEYLEAGPHTITFTCTGKHDSASHYWLGADNLVLKPKNALPLLPGTWIKQSLVVGEKLGGSIRLYPNPASEHVTLQIALSERDSDLLGGVLTVTIVDVAGRQTSFSYISQLDSPRKEFLLPTGELPGGAYFLRASIQSHSRVKTLTAPIFISY